jgi:HEAT repeat protein
MTPPPHDFAPELIGTAAVLVAVVAALLIARLAARRDRERRRERVEELGAALIGVEHGEWSIADFAAAAAATDAELFWTALENATLERPLPARAVRALRANPHVRAERRALRDDSPWRRELAARRLGLVPLDAARRALRRALARGPEIVTQSAALALARQRDGAALGWILRHPGSFARRTPRARFELLRAFGRGAHPRLLAALDRGIADAALERAVIDALGAGGCHAAAPTIARRIQGAQVELRIAAARALGRIEARETALALLAALSDPEWMVRAQAARSLGRCGGPEAVGPLGARLEDSAWWVRHHAAHALARLGDAGRAELARIATRSSDRYAREMAEQALAAG